MIIKVTAVNFFFFLHKNNIFNNNSLMLHYNCNILLWGQFLPRSSIALVVIFDLESPTLEEKPSSSCHIRDD